MEVNEFIIVSLFFIFLAWMFHVWLTMKDCAECDGHKKDD